MYILRLLRGGVPDRCDHARPWIRAGEFQCEQSDLPEGADAGAGSSAYGSQSGVCAIGNGRRRDGELKNFEIFTKRRSPKRDRRCCMGNGRQSPVVGRWSFAPLRTTRDLMDKMGVRFFLRRIAND